MTGLDQVPAGLPAVLAMKAFIGMLMSDDIHMGTVIIA